MNNNNSNNNNNNMMAVVDMKQIEAQLPQCVRQYSELIRNTEEALKQKTARVVELETILAPKDVKIHGMHTQLQTVQQELTDRKEELQNLQDVLRETQRNLVEALGEIKRRQNEQEELDRLVQQQQEKALAFQEVLQMADDRATAAETHVRVMNKKMSTFQAGNRQLQTTCNRLLDKFEKQSAERFLLVDDLNAAQVALTKLDRKAAIYDAKMSAMKLTVATANARVAELEEQVELSKQRTRLALRTRNQLSATTDKLRAALQAQQQQGVAQLSQSEATAIVAAMGGSNSSR
jgi:chromosome segregation ATPase